MKLQNILKRTGLMVTAITMFAASTAQLSADTIYWDGAGNLGWELVANWSTDINAATPDPVAVPGAADVGHFNITGANASTNVFLNGTQFLQGIVRTSTGTVNFRGGGVADQTLNLGSGGINNLTTGTLSIGSTTANQGVNVDLVEDQTWTTATAGTFVIDGSVGVPASVSNTTRTLTLDGAGTGGNFRLSDAGAAITDGAGSGNVLRIVKNGSGKWAFAGASTFTGGITVNDGTVAITAAQAIGSGPITMNGGALDGPTSGTLILTTNNAQTWNNNFAFVGTRALNVGTGNVTMNANIQITQNGADGNSNALTIGGAIAETSSGLSLTKTGTGRLALTGQSTFTGGVTLLGGSLALANASSNFAGSTGPLGTGTLTISGGNFVTNSALTDVGTIENNIVFAPVANNSIGLNGFTTLSGVISGSGDWTKGTDGTLALTNTNTFTGKLAIQRGAVQVSSIKNEGVNSGLGAATGTSAVIGLGGSTSNSATLKYIGTGDTTNRPIDLAMVAGATGMAIDQSGDGLLKFASDFTSSTAVTKTLTLTGSSAGTGEVAGTIVDNNPANPTSIAKAGTGAWTLSGTNTYTGTTTVAGGTLFVNGSHGGGGAYVVNASGTLGGTGTIGSSVAVDAGGILSPGAGVGTLTVNSAAIAGTLKIEFNGSTIDKLVAGALDLSNATIDFDNLGVTPLSGSPHIFATYTSLSGNPFTTVLDLPAGYSINYNYLNGNQIALVGGSLQPGDFDSDGDVDGADFVAWQTNFPTESGATLAQGDADADGDVDGADFVVWQTNFPFTPGPGASPVPEPGTMLLSAFALAGLGAVSRRFRRN